jgi:hypothetical protein
LPAVLVLALTLVISFVSRHPAGLFFTNSIRGIPARFVVATLALVLPLWMLPAILGLTGKIVKNNPWLGQFVMTTTSIDQDLGISIAWILRPVQGMSVSLIFAERFLSFLESSVQLRTCPCASSASVRDRGRFDFTVPLDYLGFR